MNILSKCMLALCVLVAMIVAALAHAATRPAKIGTQARAEVGPRAGR
jgi:hypothetical protein